MMSLRPLLLLAFLQTITGTPLVERERRETASNRGHQYQDVPDLVQSDSDSGSLKKRSLSAHEQPSSTSNRDFYQALQQRITRGRDLVFGKRHYGDIFGNPDDSYEERLLPFVGVAPESLPDETAELPSKRPFNAASWIGKRPFYGTLAGKRESLKRKRPFTGLKFGKRPFLGVTYGKRGARRDLFDDGDEVGFDSSALDKRPFVSTLGKRPFFGTLGKRPFFGGLYGHDKRPFANVFSNRRIVYKPGLGVYGYMSPIRG